MAKDSGDNKTDDLSNRVELLKEDTRAFINDLSKDCCFNDNNATLRVKRLSDGIDESDCCLENIFISGEIKTLSELITFEKLPVIENIEKYEYPLLLISDENEIDKYARQRIIKRKEHEFDIFPLLIFCDDFFTVRAGESFEYISIIESFEQACGCRAMALKMFDARYDNKFVRAYVNYLAMALRLREAKVCVENVFKYIDDVIDQLQIVINDVTYNDIKKLAAITKKRNYYNFREKLRRDNRKLDELAKRADGLMENIRKEYDEHICGIMKKEPLKNASPMAVRIDLKYGNLKNQLLDFLKEVSKSKVFTCNNSLLGNIVALKEESDKDMNTNTSELTLIGTFSSGKTTMINTFLGHTHKLHTSRNHNTAVLTQIMKKPDTKPYEFYEVMNKKEIKWNLIKPVYSETNITNPFPGQTKVVSIRREEQCHIVKLMEISGEKRTCDIHIAKMHKLCVSKHDVISGGASLIYLDKSEKELRLASKTELQVLIDYISKKRISNPVIEVSYRKGKKEYKDNKAITFLKKLGSCNKYDQIKLKNRQPMVSAEDLSKLMGGEIVFATFSAVIHVEDENVKLDNNGWEDFCGAQEQGQLANSIIPFCESPECYLLADRIRVYLDCEFLNYCSLNDTPGFGSITEEHDACTERFVSSSKSPLLAMITIDSKSEDKKLYDFLNFITNVYQNFRKNQINEAYFMLNCFSNNAVEQKLKSDVEKVSKLIVGKGFNENNIYVCDLRKATEESQEMDEMWGYPSYAKFKRVCVNNMLEMGLASRYRGIYNAWKGYFKDNIGFINDRISILKDNKEAGENQIEAYKNKIKAVKAVENPTIDGIIKKVKDDVYDRYYNYIETTFCGTKKCAWGNKRPRREACINLMEIIEKEMRNIDEYEVKIKEVVKNLLQKLECASDIFFDKKFIYENLRDPNYTIFTLAIENIKEKLLTADDEICWYNKKDQTDYMREIRRIFDEDYEESSKRAREYFGELKRIYSSKKEQVLATLTRELEAIENPETIEKEIESYRETLEEILRLKSVFENTINVKALRTQEESCNEENEFFDRRKNWLDGFENMIFQRSR